ncbi:MAG: TolC family protein [Bryobacteraceae bacterium]
MKSLLRATWFAGMLGAVAADAASPPATRLADLIAEALHRHPKVQLALQRYQSARQRMAQEGALPDPVLSVGYASVGRPYPLAGLGAQPMANAGLMFMQEFPAPGKRRLRAALAYQEAEALYQQYQAVRLQLVARLKQAYYRLAYAHAAAGVLERYRKLLEEMLESSEARYRAGLAPQADVFKLQTEMTLLEARLARLEQERAIQEAEIQQILARPAGAGIGAPEPLPPPVELPPLASLLEAAARNSPVLVQREKSIAGAELALNLAHRQFSPDWGLSAGYFSMGRMGSMYMFRAEFTLPFLNGHRWRAAVAENLERVSAERRSHEAEALSLRLRIQQEYLAAGTAARLARLFRENVIPLANLTLQASLASYQTGASDLLTVLSNFQGLLEHELSYYAELAGYHSAVSRLEELTGGVLPQ